MKYCVAFGIVASLFALSPVLAQDLNSFSLRASKEEVCRSLNNSQSDTLGGTSKCPALGDFVTIDSKLPTIPGITQIKIAFQNSTIDAIWSDFPSRDFESVYAGAKKKYGKPTWEKEVKAGEFGAIFANRLIYWHKKSADIYLEQYSQSRGEEMLGWLALNLATTNQLVFHWR